MKFTENRKTKVLVFAAVVAIFAVLAGNAGKSQHSILRAYEMQRDEMLAAGIAEDAPEYQVLLQRIEAARARIAQGTKGYLSSNKTNETNKGVRINSLHSMTAQAEGYRSSNRTNETNKGVRVNSHHSMTGGQTPGWNTGHPLSKGGSRGGGGLRGGEEESPFETYGDWLTARLLRGMGLPPPDQLSAANYTSGLMCLGPSAPPEGWHTNAPPQGAEFLWGGPWGEFGECEHFPVEGMRFKLGNRSPWPQDVFVTTDGIISFDALIDPADVRAMPDEKAQTYMAVLGGEISFSPAAGSRFWKSVTDEGFTVRWENVCLLRDTSAVATFEAEGSFLTGDFCYRIALSPGFDVNILTNFTVGAQSEGIGETVNVQKILDYLTQNNTREVELRWRVFPELNPDAIAGDTTGKLLTDWESITLGLSPVLRDSDGDNLWDIDELVAELDAKNPDTTLAGAVDFDNPSPDVWTDMAARVVPDGLTLLDKIHNRLPLSAPCVTNLTPRGVPEWVEVHLYGIPDPASYTGPLPGDADGKHPFFKATVTLHAPVLPPGAVLWLGESPLLKGGGPGGDGGLSR
ncbi:MAG: hypothetical protein FWH21_09665, partial [Kiritimatiellaeota bacterium]|nr:hypothetical protein [Kiritimatiellota bacterium]